MRAVCPRPNCLDGDIDRTAGCHCVPPVEKSCRTWEVAAPSSAGANNRWSVCYCTLVPNPERAPVFVNKPVTWPRQPAPRAPGTLRKPPRNLASITLAEPGCAGARPSPGRTALTRVDSAPRPREPSPRSTWRQAARSDQRRAWLLRTVWRRRTARLTLLLPARS